jgi:hypothetical protein
MYPMTRILTEPDLREDSSGCSDIHPIVMKMERIMFTEIVKSVSGTAGEALETKAYNGMLQRYGDPRVVKAIVEAELHAAGETWESLHTYLRVKTKIQNDEISFIRAAKEAESNANEALREMGFRPT